MFPGGGCTCGLVVSLKNSKILSKTKFTTYVSPSGENESDIGIRACNCDVKKSRFYVLDNEIRRFNAFFKDLFCVCLS